MPDRPRIDIHQKVRELPSHSDPLPPESVSPILHYEKSVTVNFGLVKYIDDHVDPASSYQAVADKYTSHLRRLVLANLIEIFERLLKELAAVCVDQIAGFVNDGRFDKFTAKGSQIVAHFGAKSIGKALCESDTWLNNNDINERFRNLLKLPFTDPDFNLFPKEDRSPKKGEGKAPKDLEKDRIKVEMNDRTRTLALLWQLRHNLTHNSGVLTGSDAMKLRMLCRGGVEADRILTPSRADLRFVQSFLTDTAHYANRTIGHDLALLLTEIHRQNPTVFDNQVKADEVSQIFRLSLEIAGARGVA